MLFTSSVVCRLKASAYNTKAVWQLTPEDLQHLFDEQQGCCYFTGVPLKLEVTTTYGLSKRSGKRITTFDSKGLTASLDRINPSLGYVRSKLTIL